MSPRHGNINDIVAELREKTNAYHTAKTEIREAEVFVRELREALDDRINKWITYRGHITIRAKICFTELMRKRGYNGRLVFDLKAGTLKLDVRLERSNLHHASLTDVLPSR